MIETKTIFIDGVPGSGKTTLSQWLNTELIKNGTPTKLYLEMCDDHPLRVYDPLYTDLSQPQQAQEYRARSVARYAAFVQAAKGSNVVTLFDSRLFQGTIRFAYFLRMDFDAAIDLSFDLFGILAELKPVLIYVAQEDVEANWRRICQERGTAWAEEVCGITGEAHFVRAGITWSTIQAYCLALIRKWEMQKLVITNTDYDWDEHKVAIKEFLRI